MAQGIGDGLVTYERRGDVAVIGIDRPDKRNAITARMVEAIHDAVESDRLEARAGVIHGHGDDFCAGLDLLEHPEKPLLEAARGSRRRHAISDGIERGAIPFASAPRRATVGGGFELAAATHVRVADPTAFFGLPEGPRCVFVHGGGSVRIARLIGPARMAENAELKYSAAVNPLPRMPTCRPRTSSSPRAWSRRWRP